MDKKLKTKRRLEERRRRRVRSKIGGVSDCPRLTVSKSLKHIYAQLVDDTLGQTLAQVSSTGKALRARLHDAKNKTEKAKLLGLAIAEMAREKGITRVVFDRNRNLYHGRVRALADGAREGGLEF
ncbi:MAG: 50S ribosomal protein L18 [Candidatus Zixiibacteriota bacterium]